MKVPHRVTPRTRPSSQALQGYNIQATPEAFGAGIGRAVQQFGAELSAREERRRLEAEQEAKQLQQFQARKLMANHALTAERDLNDRVLSAPLGAQGFTDNLMSDYAAKHEEILTSMREQGYDEEIVQDTELHLIGVRESLQSRGMRFQNDSRVAKVSNDISDLGLDLSQLASMSPAEMENAIGFLETSIDAIPGIDAVTRQAIKDEQRATIRRAAGLGLAQQDPAMVVSALGGNSGDYYSKIRSAESGGNDAARNPASSATGRYQFTSGTWAGLVERYPDAGLTVDGRLDPAQQEIAIRLFTEENRRELASVGIPDTHANLYAAHFLGAGGAKQVLGAPSTALVANIVSPAVTAANPFLRGMTVADFQAWTLRKTGGGQLARPTDGKTGNPVLDALTVPERQQVLSAAQTALNQQQAAFRAGVEMNVENASAAYMIGQEPGGPIPTAADFYRAYEPMEAEQRLAAFQATQRTGAAIADMRTMTPEEITAAVQASMPQDTASPTYAVELEGHEAIRTAARTVLDQRQADPAGYVTRNFPQVAQQWQAAAAGEASMQQAFASMNAAYETLGVPLWERKAFPEGTVEAQVQALASMAPEQKVDYLANLKSTAGPLFPNALSQLAEGGARTEAYLAGMVAQNPAARTVAANVLRGQRIIAEDPTRKPSEQQTQQNFRLELGDAQMFLDPAASGAMFDAAVALYVQKGGDPEVIDGTTFMEAVEEAAGGAIMPNSGGGLFGRAMPATILPPGVNEEQFNAFREGLTTQDFGLLSTDGGMPLYATGEAAEASDIYDEGKFVRVGPTSYIIMMASDGQPLLNAMGQRYVINLDRATVLDALGAM